MENLRAALAELERIMQAETTPEDVQELAALTANSLHEILRRLQ